MTDHHDEGDPATIPEMLGIRVERDGNRPFLILPGGAELSYAGIAERADRLRTMLASAGVRPGDVVGLYLWNDPAWFVAVLATWGLGAVAALCGVVSPATEAARRFGLVQPVIVVASDDASGIGIWPEIRLAHDGLPATPEPGPPAAPAAPRVQPRPEDPACIFFTSGTTGGAKALVKDHGSLAAAPRRTAAAYSRSARFRPRVAAADKPPGLSFNPFGQSASFGRLVFRLYVGRPLVMIRKFDVGVVAEMARKYQLDTLQLTPAMIHMLTFAETAVDLRHLRYVNSGTAPLPAATREAFESRYGVPVLQAYGSTEGGVTALEHYEDVTAGLRGPGSVGRITADSVWKIVDADGTEVGAGHEGELLGRPSQSRLITADGESSLPLDADGWYHTGDLGRVDEHGILYITGRIKEMLIVGGFNVFPSEVEDVLRESPFVRDAVVAALPDQRLGEIPVAGIVWEPEAVAACGERELVTGLLVAARTHLAAYKLPRRWFSLTELPMTPNGKLDRDAAAARAARAAKPLEELAAAPG